MGDANTKLVGPDLRQGVDAHSIKEGEPLLGHADGEAVLITRLGRDVVAIGATCTHYSGPLAEGLIVGETVRCPWHHACFSLRTGEALRAPALNPVACWNVEESDGRIVVTGKAERDPLAPTADAKRAAASRQDAPRRIVVVGAGAAGAAAAEMLRREGFAGSITIVDDDADAPYDRPNLSKDYLAGNAPEDWIPLRPPNFYADHGIDVVRGRAVRVNSAGRTVEVQGREPLPYDALLLATGAEPVRLSLPGADKPHVHYLRSLADSRAIIQRAKSAKRALVMGASFIGLEVAASLRARNLSVDVVAPDKAPLARVLGDELGGFIRALHEEHGVRFHLEQKAARIEDDHVVLENGERVPADLVVLGVGVRPRLDLAESAGCAMDKGVLVNELLRTNIPSIWAAGDIARWPDPHTGQRIRVEHWVLAERHGQAAARNILGANIPFGEAPFFWSAHYDVTINYVGHAEQWDAVEVEGDVMQRDATVRFVRNGRALAVATVGRDHESLRAEVAMEREVGALLQ